MIERKQVKKASVPPDSKDFVAGQTIPGTKYRVVGLLGRGAFGTVYECVETTMDIACAVKIVNADIATHPEIEQAMLIEGKQLAKISSDHVVKVRAMGTTSEASPRIYIDMFLLEGESLHDVLYALRRLAPLEAIIYASHVAMGLDAGHRVGLVHCDVKAANIFLAKLWDPLTQRDVTRGVVLDYGVGRVVSRGDTRNAIFRGTHGTAAPEQYRGQYLPQSDIYALGVTFFLMLTGQHPHGPVNNVRDLVAAKTQLGRIKRLSNVLPAIDPAIVVDPELDDLLWRMLQPDPVERPGSMGQVLAELSIIQEREEQRLLSLVVKGKSKSKPKGRIGVTVPEPPEKMRARMEGHYQTLGQPLPNTDLEDAPVSIDELCELLATKRYESKPPFSVAADRGAAQKRQIERYAAGETNRIGIETRTNDGLALLERTEPLAGAPSRADAEQSVGRSSAQPPAADAADLLDEDDPAVRAFFLGKSTLESAADGSFGEEEQAPRAADARVVLAPPPAPREDLRFPAPDRHFRDPRRASTFGAAVLPMPPANAVATALRQSRLLRFLVGLAAGALVLSGIYRLLLYRVRSELAANAATPSAAAPVVSHAPTASGNPAPVALPIPPPEPVVAPAPSGKPSAVAAPAHPSWPKAPTVATPVAAAPAPPPVAAASTAPHPAAPAPTYVSPHQGLLDEVNKSKDITHDIR